jgi:amidase
MDRRSFLRNGSLAGLSLSALSFAGPEGSGSPGLARDFPLEEATIDGLQQKMSSGELSSKSLTQLYLKRIAEIDKKGPSLNPMR